MKYESLKKYPWGWSPLRWCFFFVANSIISIPWISSITVDCCCYRCCRTGLNLNVEFQIWDKAVFFFKQSSNNIKMCPKGYVFHMEQTTAKECVWKERETPKCVVMGTTHEHICFIKDHLNQPRRSCHMNRFTSSLLFPNVWISQRKTMLVWQDLERLIHLSKMDTHF